jgi:hypothetical protein
MASIGYSSNSAFGSKVNSTNQQLRLAQETLARVKTVMDDITAGGTVPANLETNTLFSVASGQGSNFYNAIVSIIGAIGALQAITDLDQG